MTILDRDRAGLPVSIDEPEYPVINEIIARAHRICAGMNTGYCPPDRVRSLFAELTETEPDETLRICPPLHVGFGKNLRVGKNVFFNTGCTIIDRGGVTIGDDTFLGPNVSLITTNHGLAPSERRSTVSKPIVLGKNVWIGAGAIVLPGVTIGDNSVVGAGAVVTRNIPANTVAAGNPACVLRSL